MQAPFAFVPQHGQYYPQGQWIPVELPAAHPMPAAPAIPRIPSQESTSSSPMTPDTSVNTGSIPRKMTESLSTLKMRTAKIHEFAGVTKQSPL